MKKPIFARGGKEGGIVEVMEFATGWTEGHTKAFMKCIGLFLISLLVFPPDLFFSHPPDPNNNNRKSFSQQRCILSPIQQNLRKFRLP